MESKRGVPEISAFSKDMLTTFPTVKSYIDEMMKLYYSSKDIFKKDFLTCATNPERVQRFSASLANQFFCTYQKLLTHGILKEGDVFHVLECGGGDGNLCFHIFHYIEEMAKRDEKWNSLLKALHYNLLECSPGLVEAQKERNKKYVDLNKVTVIEGNALNLSDSIKESKFALAISNELIDMFQPHIITMEKDRTIYVKQVLPYISEKDLRSLVANDRFSELKKQSDDYKKNLIKNIKKEEISSIKSCLQADQILLSESAFVELRHPIPQDKYQSQFQFQFHEVGFVPANSIPEVNDFLKRHPKFVERMQIGKDYTIEVGIQPYLRGLKKILIPHGEVIVIDYARSADAVTYTLRTYCKGKMGENIYDKPGIVDVTHDVNATIFVEESLIEGFSCLFFGSQNYLPVDAFPSDVLSAEAKYTFDRASTSDYFNAIVLSNSESSESLIDIKQFSGKKKKPVTYAELDAIPPVFSINNISGEIEIHFTEEDIELILYSALIIRRRQNALLTGSTVDDGDGEMWLYCRRSFTALQKMQAREILSKEDKKSLMRLDVLGFRLKKYPSESDIIAAHLKNITNRDWNVQLPNAYLKINVSNQKAVIADIEESLKKVGLVDLSIMVEKDKKKIDHVLLCINDISDDTPWKNYYLKKPSEKKLAEKIHSPITAQGDAHAAVVAAIRFVLHRDPEKKQKNEKDFKPFLDLIKEKEYSKALRTISSSQSHFDLVHDVAEIFLQTIELEKRKGNHLKFDINEQPGSEKLTALHQAAKKSNKRLFNLLFSYGADINAKDVNGHPPAYYMQQPLEKQIA